MRTALSWCVFMQRTCLWLGFMHLDWTKCVSSWRVSHIYLFWRHVSSQGNRPAFDCARPSLLPQETKNKKPCLARLARDITHFVTVEIRVAFLIVYFSIFHTFMCRFRTHEVHACALHMNTACDRILGSMIWPYSRTIKRDIVANVFQWNLRRLKYSVQLSWRVRVTQCQSDSNFYRKKSRHSDIGSIA